MFLMGKGRLEAFSDGVLAIIITIMVLEVRAPHEADLEALRPLVPVLLAYVLSFVHVGIYWNGHHNLLHSAKGLDGWIMWGNLHLLFWLSLVPFGTAWMGETGSPAATAVYGVLMVMCAVAYNLLQAAVVRHEPPNSELRLALGRDVKGKVSVACYVAAIALAYWHPFISWGLFVFVALMWLAPDRRMVRQRAAAAE